MQKDAAEISRLLLKSDLAFLFLILLTFVFWLYYQNTQEETVLVYMSPWN